MYIYIYSQTLLRAVEEYREQLASPVVQRAVMVSGAGAGRSTEDGESGIGKGMDAQSYIAKQLVTFRNVEELQDQNQKLLKVVRQLSADMDNEAEVRKEQLRAEYGKRIEQALAEVQDMRSERDVLEAEKRSLSEQRDMYRILLAEADRSYIQTEDEAPGVADVRASAAISGSGFSDVVVSPSVARARSASDAVRKLQQEMNEMR